MSPEQARRYRRMADLDAGRFDTPAHGIERYEHHGCRCDVCTEAHRRVERLALRLDNELRRHGRA